MKHSVVSDLTMRKHKQTNWWYSQPDCQ